MTPQLEKLVPIFSKARVFCFTSAVLLASSVSFSSSVIAEDVTLKERQHYRANTLREQSKARSQAQLGYDHIYRDSRSRQIDFYSLAHQISLLSNLINRMNEEQAMAPASQSPLLPTTGSNIGSNVTLAAYGPKGPTIKSVKLLTEYQLMRLGNDRLKVGPIVDQDKFILVDIVTVDGSLVERYSIDKAAGNWVAQR